MFLINFFIFFSPDAFFPSVFCVCFPPALLASVSYSPFFRCQHLFVSYSYLFFIFFPHPFFPSVFCVLCVSPPSRQRSAEQSVDGGGVMLPPLEQADEYAPFLSESICQHLDEEWLPQECHKSIGEEVARLYRETAQQVRPPGKHLRVLLELVCFRDCIYVLVRTTAVLCLLVASGLEYRIKHTQLEKLSFSTKSSNLTAVCF